MANLHPIVHEREQMILSLLEKQDKRALLLLYTHYSPALFNIILKIIPDRHTAEEILQDTYLKIWNNHGKYDSSKGRLFTWVARIARNAAIDHYRSKQHQTTTKVSELDTTAPKISRLTAPNYMQDSGLRLVVSKMDKKYHNIIDCLYFQNYTQQETSEELDIPLGTVKSRLRAALLRLRKVLAAETVTLEPKINAKRKKQFITTDNAVEVI